MKARSEGSTIKSIEKRFMKKSRRQIYIALEEADHTWCVDEVNEFQEMWNDGKSVLEMCTHFRRHPIEVVLLVIDRTEHGYISPRLEGLGQIYEQDGSFVDV